MFVLQSASSPAIHSEPVDKEEMRQKLFHVSQTRVRVEIKIVYTELGHHFYSIRTQVGKEFYKNLRKDFPCPDNLIGN